LIIIVLLVEVIGIGFETGFGTGFGKCISKADDCLPSCCGFGHLKDAK
jgi:hypothetical protein